MKVAIYTRVSTIEKGQDAENQRSKLVDYCLRSNYELVKEYSDNVSGSKSREQRPDFDLMLNDARLRKFDAVLVWALDRFTREGVYKCFEYIQKLNQWNVGFISHQEEYLNTLGIWKEALMAIMATLAQQERLRISERVKAGLDRTKAKGTVLGRPKVSHRKKETKILELRREGVSIRAIAIECNIGISTVQRVLAVNHSVLVTS